MIVDDVVVLINIMVNVVKVIQIMIDIMLKMVMNIIVINCSLSTLFEIILINVMVNVEEVIDTFDRHSVGDSNECYSNNHAI